MLYNMIRYLSGLPLPWDEGDSMKKKLLLTAYDTFVACILLLRVVCTAYVIANSEGLMDRIFAGAIEVFYLTAGSLNTFFAINRKSFDRFLKEMDLVTERIVRDRLDGHQEFVELFVRDSVLITKFAVWLLVTGALMPTLYILSVPAIGILQGGYGTELTVPVHCPFEIVRPALYEFHLILEIIGQASNGAMKTGAELFIIVLLKIHAGYFTYLRMSLRNILGNISRERNGDETDLKLKTWIQQHQAVARRAGDLVRFISPVVVVYYFCITCIVAGIVFYLINAGISNYVIILSGGIYLSMTMVQLYVLCHMAENVSIQAEKLASEMYYLPWYNFNATQKKKLGIMLTVAQRPIKIVAYRVPSFVLDRKTFSSLAVNIISAYMGYSKLNSIDK